MRQEDVEQRGWAIECRINAEDPELDFRPSAGKIEHYLPAGGPGVRVDSFIYSGYIVPPYYDSLLGKLIVWGRDRDEAIRRMQRALQELERDGLVYSQRTAGRFVTEEKKLIDDVKRAIAESNIKGFLDSMSRLGYGKKEIIALIESENGEVMNNARV